MNQIINILFLLLLCIALFVLGNFIYTLEQAPLFLKILISEMSFIIIYTITDKANIKYGFLFSSILVVVFCIIFVFGLFGGFISSLFYSIYVQNWSLVIMILVSLINALMLKNLLNKKFSHLISSRISTSIASIIEVSLFAFLLDIGFLGGLITLSVRIIYIFSISKFFFNKL
jgi:hypothetical protein